MEKGKGGVCGSEAGAGGGEKAHLRSLAVGTAAAKLITPTRRVASAAKWIPLLPAPPPLLVCVLLCMRWIVEAGLHKRYTLKVIMT